MVRAAMATRWAMAVLLAAGCGGGNGSAGGAGDGGVDVGAEPDGLSDAQPDAAPPTCDAPAMCVEEPPASWSGPVVLFEGAAGDPLPECAGGYPSVAIELEGQLDGGAPSCACSCGAPTGVSCGEATVKGWNDPDCASPFDSAIYDLPPDSCVEITNDHTHYSLIQVPEVSGGQCAPALSESIPEPSWGTGLRACGTDENLDGAGCEAGQLCVPAAAEPSGGAICIYMAGDVTCPTDSAFGERLVRYAGFSDTRSCSDTCTCGAPSGSCAGSVELAHDEGGGAICDPDTVDGLLTPSSCLSASSTTDATYLPEPDAACAPSSSSQLQGELVPTEPTTFCCLTP